MVADLCNGFLTAKTRKLDAGELSVSTLAEYRHTTDWIVAQFKKDRLVNNLASDDFAALRANIAKRWGPVRSGNEITRVKSVFKFGLDNGLIDRPVRFGSEFKKPSKAVLRKCKAASGGNMMEADELRRLLDSASVQVKAMLLMGLNCGFGLTDCAKLPQSALNFESGWVDYPRVKTGIERRCPLWPETVAAIRAAIAERPEPRQDGATGLVFKTARGR